MSVKVRIPTPLRKLTQDTAEVTAEGGTISELIDSLESQFPGFKERLCDTDGTLRRFVNVYVGEEDIRFLNGMDTQVPADEVVSIIPAVAGG
ncbi:MAG TPA: MoaD/ThiS family protein [Actinomycetota bacterium]|nr:MoaD/ThiS family protein [Actinomycetota bacterium]